MIRPGRRHPHQLAARSEPLQLCLGRRDLPLRHSFFLRHSLLLRNPPLFRFPPLLFFLPQLLRFFRQPFLLLRFSSSLLLFCSPPLLTLLCLLALHLHQSRRHVLHHLFEFGGGGHFCLVVFICEGDEWGRKFLGTNPPTTPAIYANSDGLCADLRVRSKGGNTVIYGTFRPFPTRSDKLRRSRDFPVHNKKH